MARLLMVENIAKAPHVDRFSAIAFVEMLGFIERLAADAPADRNRIAGGHLSPLSPSPRLALLSASRF